MHSSTRLFCLAVAMATLLAASNAFSIGGGAATDNAKLPDAKIPGQDKIVGTGVTAVALDEKNSENLSGSQTRQENGKGIGSGKIAMQNLSLSTLALSQYSLVGRSSRICIASIIKIIICIIMVVGMLMVFGSALYYKLGPASEKKDIGKGEDGGSSSPIGSAFGMDDDKQKRLDVKLGAIRESTEPAATTLSGDISSPLKGSENAPKPLDISDDKGIQGTGTLDTDETYTPADSADSLGQFNSREVEEAKSQVDS